MADLQERIMEILRAPKLSSLATLTEDGKPWVRCVVAIAGDDMSIRCATFVGSRKVNQIAANPEVHLACGVTDPAAMAPYLQIQAHAELTTDKADRHTFWNPTLASIFDGPDDPKYGVLVMRPYRIEDCTPGSMTPEVWEA